MSAAAAWDTLPATGPFAPSGSRPDLRLVPTGEAAVARRPVRLTRFGRLLLAVAAVAVAVVVGLTLVGATSASAGIDHTVTVRSGQTLSEIAQRELPQVSIPEGVAQIQLVNGLSSAQVHAGQQLAIPDLR